MSFCCNERFTPSALFAEAKEEPLEIRNPGLMQTSDVVARDNGQVLVLAWKDKQVVKAITKHDASVITIARQKKRGGGETRAG